ncbi:hypothetical protein HDV00_012585, partial [Rhizophlyctis rosea]
MSAEHALCVRGLQKDVRARDLAIVFETVGPVAHIDIPIMKGGSNNDNKVAFVVYDRPEDAARAARRLHKSTINKQTIS